MGKSQYNSQAVIVTGAGSGIGLATATLLADKGYTVYGSYRKAMLEPLLVKCGIKPFRMELENQKDIEQAISGVLESIGEQPLAALVNNAGYSLCVPWEILAPEDFRSQMEVNLVAPAFISRLCIPKLKRSKGKIIMLSSTAAIYGAPMMGPYTCSKAGLEFLADTMRRELWFDGVDVVSVRPGPVKTGIFDKTLQKNNNLYAEEMKTPLFGKFEKISRDLQKDGLSPEVLAGAVYRMIVKKKTPAIITVAKAKWVYYLISWLPARWVDRITAWFAYGKERLNRR